MNKNFRSQIMDNAHTLYRSGIFKTWSSALRGSWSRFKLVTQLMKGETEFAFIKATGEVREAVGTLNEDLFTYEYKTEEARFLAHVVNFWDLQKNSWRSVRIDRLINA